MLFHEINIFRETAYHLKELLCLEYNDALS